MDYILEKIEKFTFDTVILIKTDDKEIILLQKPKGMELENVPKFSKIRINNETNKIEKFIYYDGLSNKDAEIWKNFLIEKVLPEILEYKEGNIPLIEPNFVNKYIVAQCFLSIEYIEKEYYNFEGF